MTAHRIFFTGRSEAKTGHGGYLNLVTTSRTVDNQEAVLDAVRAERARRALYADCDRAPLGWENCAA